MSASDLQLTDPWSDLDLYDRCSAEGRAAYANNLPLDECPYPANTAERSAWMDGFDV